MRSKIFSNHTIAGRRYELTKLPILISGRIAAKVGVSLIPAIASIQGVDLKDIPKLCGAISTILDKLNPEDVFDDAMKCVSNGCTVDGVNITQNHDFEKHFGDYPQDLFPLLLWALKENIGGFFDLAALFQGSKQESNSE